MPTVAHLLVQMLKDAGVELVFGLPGGENVEVMEALRQHGLRFVLVRNESAALFMADVTARLTGKPGVCLTTLGPGATNAYVGVAHAYLDRAPVLLITAETNQEQLPGHTHQVLNLQAVFQPVTKLTRSLTPANAQQTVQQALTTITGGRPGPAHLSLSRQMARQPAILSNSKFYTRRGSETPDRRSVRSLPVGQTGSERQTPIDVSSARAILAQAKRPVIVVGLGMEPEQPYTALRALAEAANAPVIVTPKAKGSLPDDQPLSAGTIGLTRTDPVYEILDEADCIIAVGFDVVELVKPWDQQAPLIWVAPWPNDDPPISAVAEFIGPMQPVLKQLSNLKFETNSAWGPARVAALRHKLKQRPLPSPAAGRLLPQAVLEAVRQHAPPETLIATDVGSHKIFTALNWPAYRPNRYMVSNGLSAMGFGVTGAIAAAITLEQPVVCITGDAGFGMVIGELSLLTEFNLPLIIVVMNDSALDLIRSAQRRAGKLTFGTEFVNPDFEKIAQAYGLDFYRVAEEKECAKAVASALRANRPALIEALIDPVGYPTTPQTIT